MISERSQDFHPDFVPRAPREAAKIKGMQEKELKDNRTSEAYLEKQKIIGQADAKAVAIYAEAFDQSDRGP